ncbi:hypothetical protein DM860_016381 [Cuscuta australis]|uniref:Tyrosine N-monooxygenase n=1 Tax=Cuscuta australis TaxID=267555 RepID=A0A328DEA7_9ASTE|nr:hypothetical protein DM860_016381 [Cuscuta australis]
MHPSPAMKASSSSGTIPAVLVITASIIVIVVSCLRMRKKRRGRERPPLPPGPKGWPVVGSLPEMIMAGRWGKMTPSRWILKLMGEMGTEMACVRLGNTHVITVTSPELATEFLRKQDECFSSRPTFTSLKLTTGGFKTIFSMPPHANWKRMRRILASHVLSPAAHDWLHDKRVDEAHHLIRFLYHHYHTTSGSPVNVRAVARQYCGNVIRRLTLRRRSFDNDNNNNNDNLWGPQEEEHVEAFFTLLKYTFAFGIADYIPWLAPLDIDGHISILTKAVDTARKYIDPEIDERILMWKNGNKTVKEDMADVLITLVDEVDGSPLLTHHEIKDLVFEMMIATMDNPLNAFEWALAEMLINGRDEMLEKAREELDRVVGRERLVEESDLPRLNYVKACIREAFRLHPIAPFNVPHASTRDAVVGGYFIPKGSVILVSRYGLGRNPRVFEDPLKFMPERHLVNNDEEEMIKLVDPECRILSFGTGRRGCVGVRLGTVITTMLFARLLQAFTWPDRSPRRSCISN